MNQETPRVSYQVERYLSFAGFALGGVLIVVAAWYAFHHLGSVTGSQASPGRQFNDRAEAVFTLLKDAETSAFEYLLTGDAASLDAYQAAAKSLPADLVQLGEMARDNPTQYANLSRLNVVASSWMGQLQQTIAERRERGLPAAVAFVQGHSDKNFRAESRKLITAIREDDARFHAEREVARAQAARQSTRLIFGGLVLGIVLIVGSSFLLADSNRKRVWERYGQEVFWNLLELKKGSLPRGARPEELRKQQANPSAKS